MSFEIPQVSPRKTGKATPVVLSIAGSDPCAGAGIQADIKAGAAMGVHVATVITAVTAQNSLKLASVYPLPLEQVMAQVTSVIEGLSIQAVKLGMMGNEECIVAVSSLLDSLSLPVIVDPVLSATAGGDLLDRHRARELYLEHLLPRATLLTPNIAEAAFLLSEPEAKDYPAMVRQAQQLRGFGPEAVLLKGGHARDPLVTDVLITLKGEYPFNGSRVNTAHTHGSGCSLATAIAAGLAQGLSMQQAVATAKAFIQGAIANSERLHLVNSNGPVHALYEFW